MATERNPYEAIPEVQVIPVAEGGTEVEMGENVNIDVSPDGGVIVSFEDTLEVNQKETTEQWFANLAEDIDEFKLHEIAETVYERFDADRNSREEWESMFERGFDLLGLKLEEASEPFEGACTAVHPLLIESAVKFQSKASGELFPAGGPVKTTILGKEDEAKIEQAQRVEEFMNYQITEQMPEYFDEFERMLFHLPIIGSAFKKVYYDASLERPVSEFVPIDQFYVSYYASNLRNADRFTHVIYRNAVDLDREMAAGMYLDVELPDASVPNPTPISSKINTILGMSPTTDEDPQYVLLEQHCYMECEEDSEYEEGVALPYIVTMEEETRKILSIRRNYRPDDRTRQKIMHFVHYKFVPGFGFYGLGLIHFLGNLTMTATAAMRALVDAGQFANLPGGFKAKGVRIVGDNDPIAPGEFKEIEATGMDLTKSIVPLPYKEPSSTLFQMLNFVTATGQKFADSTEQVISDAASYGPVGTTMALLEASSKFFSAIHKRMHKTQKDEFKILADINHEYLPNEYPFEMPGVSRTIMKQDFDGRIDIIPVSDPNIPSNAHRMMLAQMALQLAQQSPPGMFNMEELNRTILNAANMPNLDQILPPKKKPVPLDPMSDIQAASRGLPIAAFPGQNHDAHIQIKMAFLQDPTSGKNPAMQRVVPILQANVQEHVVMKYQEQLQGVAQGLMQNLPSEQQQMPNVAEMAMAQAAQQVLNANQAMGKQQSPEAQMVDIEKQRLNIEQQKLQATLAKDAATAALKNRELDIDEMEMQVKAVTEGQKEMLDAESDEKNRINKQSIAAIKMLVDMANQESRNENDMQLKAMEIMQKLSKIQADTESKDKTAALNSLLKLLDVSVASDTSQAKELFSEAEGDD
tara:strand:+ start:1122 stop:3722 length:2601 start_codon:yes stop_codon:yes gene_type:complete